MYDTLHQYMSWYSLVLVNITDDNSMMMSATLSAQLIVIRVLGLKISDLVNHLSISLALKANKMPLELRKLPTKPECERGCKIRHSKFKLLWQS